MCSPLRDNRRHKTTEKKRGRADSGRYVEENRSLELAPCHRLPHPASVRQQSIVGDKTRALWSGSGLRGKPRNSCESGKKLYRFPAGTPQHNAAFMLFGLRVSPPLQPAAPPRNYTAPLQQVRPLAPARRGHNPVYKKAEKEVDKWRAEEQRKLQQENIFYFKRKDGKANRIRTGGVRFS